MLHIGDVRVPVCSGVNRRSFLSAGAAALAGMSLLLAFNVPTDPRPGNEVLVGQQPGQLFADKAGGDRVIPADFQALVLHESLGEAPQGRRQSDALHRIAAKHDNGGRACRRARLPAGIKVTAVRVSRQDHSRPPPGGVRHRQRTLRREVRLGPRPAP